MARLLGTMAGAACLLAMPVLGAPLEVELRAGAAYSDNVERTATNEIDTTAAMAGVRLRGARDTGRWRYALSGDLAYLEYLESGIDSEIVGGLYAESFYDIVPQSVRWHLGGSFSQVRADLLRPASPGNRENVLSLSTGPSFVARLGDALDAQLDARYALADYSDRAFDSETAAAALVVARRFSEQSLLGIGVSYADVRYDADFGALSTDFERSEAFLRFRTRGARTELEADVGYARAKGASVDDSGAMLRLRATRRLTPFVSGFAAYTQEYPTSEAPAYAPFDATAGNAGGDGSVLTGTARLTKNAELGLRLNRPRTAAELAFVRRRESDLTLATGERSFDEVRASISRALTPRSRAGVFARFSREDIGAGAFDADETSVGAELGLSFGRQLGVELRVEHRERSSPLPVAEYSELSAGLFLRWGRIVGAGRAATVNPTASLSHTGP